MAVEAGGAGWSVAAATSGGMAPHASAVAAIREGYRNSGKAHRIVMISRVSIGGSDPMPPDKPAPGTSPGQRTLAAIVFTDVVSFSARMHSDEVGTLRLLQRDFAEMRRLCADFEGQVMKTTGDGLLLTFTSAVQAVACALAMQRQFAAEAKGQPSQGGALQHRIGIRD